MFLLTSFQLKQNNYHWKNNINKEVVIEINKYLKKVKFSEFVSVRAKSLFKSNYRQQQVKGSA